MLLTVLRVIAGVIRARCEVIVRKSARAEPVGRTVRETSRLGELGVDLVEDPGDRHPAVDADRAAFSGLPAKPASAEI